MSNDIIIKMESAWEDCHKKVKQYTQQLPDEAKIIIECMLEQAFKNGFMSGVLEVSTRMKN